MGLHYEQVTKSNTAYSPTLRDFHEVDNPLKTIIAELGLQSKKTPVV